MPGNLQGLGRKCKTKVIIRITVEIKELFISEVTEHCDMKKKTYVNKTNIALHSQLVKISHIFYT